MCCPHLVLLHESSSSGVLHSFVGGGSFTGEPGSRAASERKEDDGFDELSVEHGVVIPLQADISSNRSSGFN